MSSPKTDRFPKTRQKISCCRIGVTVIETTATNAISGATPPPPPPRLYQNHRIQGSRTAIALGMKVALRFRCDRASIRVERVRKAGRYLFSKIHTGYFPAHLSIRGRLNADAIFADRRFPCQQPRSGKHAHPISIFGGTRPPELGNVQLILAPACDRPWILAVVRDAAAAASHKVGPRIILPPYQ